LSLVILYMVSLQSFWKDGTLDHGRKNKLRLTVHRLKVFWIVLI
jgi:hypothetical protein